MNVTAFTLAQRYVGVIKEVAGKGKNHPQIVAWSQLCDPSVTDDEVPWCSSFANGIAWVLRLPRSKSLAARSWLNVGQPIALEEATPGFDVVVLKRGHAPQPGPDVLQAPGHVGFFAGLEANGQRVLVLGGNQGNGVSIAAFSAADVLGIRRLSEG